MVSRASHSNKNIYYMDVNKNSTHNSRVTTFSGQTYSRCTRRTNQYSMEKKDRKQLKLIKGNDKEARKHHLLNRASAANLESRK